MYPYYARMTQKELASINLFNEDEQFMIYVLKNVLKDKDLESICNFFGYQEEKVCLSKRDHFYVVYLGQGNNMYAPFDTYDLKEACYQIISICAKTYQEEEEIRNNFDKQISL